MIEAMDPNLNSLPKILAERYGYSPRVNLHATEEDRLLHDANRRIESATREAIEQTLEVAAQRVNAIPAIETQEIWVQETAVNAIRSLTPTKPQL